MSELASKGVRALRDPRWWVLATVALALLVLLPRLGTYGFWDPHEIRVADQAQEVGQGKPIEQVAMNQPPFTLRAVAGGVDRLGVGELQARLPLALLALAAVLATFALGARLGRSRRVGLFAALIVLSSPLVLFEGRQLTSSIGATAGAAMVMLGLVGLVWPARVRTGAVEAIAPAAGLGAYFALASLAGELPAIGVVAAAGIGLALWRTDDPPWLAAAHGALVAAGAAVGYHSAGALVGVAVPLAAAAIATAAALRWSGAVLPGQDGDDDDQALRQRRAQLWIGAVALGVAAVVVLGYVLARTFDVVAAAPGERGLFGYTLRPEKLFVPALGGVWRSKVPEPYTWDIALENMVFGLFPWIALAPFALGRAIAGGATRRRTWAGHVVFAWAFLGWLAATVVAIKVGRTHFPAAPAVALAVALWLDDLLAAREAGDRRMLPIAGVFVLLVVVMLGKDLKGFPEKLASLHLATEIKWPETLTKLKLLPLVFALAFALPIWAALWRPEGPGADETDWFGRLGRAVMRPFSWVARHGVTLAFVASTVMAIALAQVWTPRLSSQLSYKELFEKYHAVKVDGARLGVMGMGGSGPDYYAKGDYAKLRNRGELVELLAEDGPRYAIAPDTDLCAIHQESTRLGFGYAVLDDSNDKFLLYANHVPPARKDRNPLQRAIVREEPTDLIKERVSVNYDNKIELIGVNMPAQVKRGDKFELILIYKVLDKPGRNWQIFAHFDGAGARFQGDHWPVDNRCGTTYWQPGDYVIDRHRLEAGNVTFAKTTYELFTGFFIGSAGNWTNMEIVAGPEDDNNRAKVGRLKVY